MCNVMRDQVYDKLVKMVKVYQDGQAEGQEAESMVDLFSRDDADNIQLVIKNYKSGVS